eukprot:gb/GECH01008590.1/.p1 GENE.gb/GECH01008590.1/~~gb/GECH01008590.1/.p1  ORF type:complete len:297 (+),score=59.54 gb/GECH01008590.1/:1-891(+)
MMKIIHILSLALLLFVLGTLPIINEAHEEEKQDYSPHGAMTQPPLLPERFHCDFYVTEMDCGDKNSLKVRAKGQFYYDSQRKMNSYLVDSVPEHGRYRIVLYKNVYYMINEGTGRCRSYAMPGDYHPVSRDFLRRNFKYLRTSWVNRGWAFFKGTMWTYDPNRIHDETHVYKYIHDVSKNTPFRFQHPLFSHEPYGVMLTDFKNFHVGFDNVDENGWLFQIPDECPEVDLASELGLWNRGGYYGREKAVNQMEQGSRGTCTSEMYRMLFEQSSNRQQDEEYMLMHPLMVQVISSQE